MERFVIDRNTIILVDTSSPEQQGLVAGCRNLLKEHTDAVRSVAFSSDRKTMASGSYDETIILWDVASGKPSLTLKGHTDWVLSVAFSPDGKTLASGSLDKTIILWDVASGKPTLTLKGHTGTVWSVAFSPDGKTLASGSSDNTSIAAHLPLKGGDHHGD